VAEFDVRQPIAPMTTNILLAVVILFLTFTCSVVAITLAFLARPGQLIWPLLLALIALFVSTMGLTAWTPFGSFPEVGWTNGEVSIRSGPLFLVPLVLGAIALPVAVWRRRKYAA